MSGDGEPLAGGMGNGGAVVRVGDTVRRPAGPYAGAIGRLLGELASVGFPAPVPSGSDEQGRAVFKWIDGLVPVPPYPDWSLSDDALASVGRLLRRYHDVAGRFSLPPGLDWSEELADPRGGPIICHNDVCPENVVFREGEAVALLDFDFASPGRPIFDLARMASMWVPLRPPGLADERAHLDPFGRLAVLADAYGLQARERRALVAAIIEGKRVGRRFVEGRVLRGEPAFVEAWEQTGGEAWFARTVDWLESNEPAFLSCLGVR